MAYSGASSASASTRGCSEACGQARHRSRGGAGPPGGHGVGGLARQRLAKAEASARPWRRRCARRRRAGGGGAVRAVARAKAAARARGGGAREKRPPGRAARRGRAARVGTVR